MGEENDVVSMSKSASVITFLISLVVAAFYIVSSAGWFLANHMMYSGFLGEESKAFFSGLTIIDHVVRVSQVLLVSIASLLLIFRKRVTLVLWLICLVPSAISTFFVGTWGVSFIGGLFPLTLLALVCIYVNWLKARQLLR